MKISVDKNPIRLLRLYEINSQKLTFKNSKGVTMKKPLWEPSQESIQNANMTRFIRLVNQKYGKTIKDFPELYDWSINRIPEFWSAMWEFGEIKTSQGYDRVVDDLTKMPGAKWFEGARLNFAENLLRYRDDRTALIFKGEAKESKKITYAQLYSQVAALAGSLRALGINPGDRG